MLQRIFTTERKRNAFLVGVALIVSSVRNLLQYHRLTFESVWEFLGFWFVHYLALALAGATYYVLLGWARRHFVGPTDAEREISVHDAMVQFSLAALVIAIASFLLYFWPHGIGDE